jgi:hypothetical protein
MGNESEETAFAGERTGARADPARRRRMSRRECGETLSDSEGVESIEGAGLKKV